MTPAIGHVQGQRQIASWDGSRPIESAVLEGRLVGVAEIGDILGVSRQRADQLARAKRWPEPVERVAPIDRYTLNAIRLLFEVAGPTITQ
jgi:hypothetical protein